jgi:hypothetical protein
MTIEDTGRKYKQDNDFAMLVNSILSLIVHLHFSPSEIREAEMYAAYLFETKYAHPKWNLYPDGTLTQEDLYRKIK